MRRNDRPNSQVSATSRDEMIQTMISPLAVDSLFTFSKSIYHAHYIPPSNSVVGYLGGLAK